MIRVLPPAYPAPSKWYQLEPFQPGLVAFRDEEGNDCVYLNSPLDEVYVHPPGSRYLPGTLPPEEREVSDRLLATVRFFHAVTWWDVLRSQFFTPSAAYTGVQVQVAGLSSLCAQSRAHRAAFCRQSMREIWPRSYRQLILRVIAEVDSSDSSAKRVRTLQVRSNFG